MTVRHMDFPSGKTGIYGLDGSLLLNGIYGQAQGQYFQLIDDPDPNITGTVVRLGNHNASPSILRRIGATTNQTAGRACRVWLANIPTAAGLDEPCIHEFRDSSNNAMVSIVVTPSGAIQARSGGAYGAALGTSGPAVILANAWQHVEAKVFMSATVGTVEVRVEGITVLNLTGLVLSANPVNQFVSYFSGSNFVGGLMYQKDLVEWDGAGAINNNFLGSVQVMELLPDSDIAFPWAASTGTTGYNLIDDAPPNEDTDYIYAIDPPPAAAKFGLSNLPVNVTSVKALMAIHRSRKTDGGDGNAQTGLISGASTALGADRPITTTYTYWLDVIETDPATAAAWTPGAVNAAQLQLNRTL